MLIGVNGGVRSDKGPLAFRPLRKAVGETLGPQVREIAEIKMADLSARDVEAGMKIIAGTARSMGITVTD